MLFGSVYNGDFHSLHLQKPVQKLCAEYPATLPGVQVGKNGNFREDAMLEQKIKRHISKIIQLFKGREPLRLLADLPKPLHNAVDTVQACYTEQCSKS